MMPPTQIIAVAIAATEVQLVWNPITYTQHGGFYGVWGKAHGDPSPSSCLFAFLSPQSTTSTETTMPQPNNGRGDRLLALGDEWLGLM